MNYIEHIIEPNRLLLSWQAPTEDRGRNIVAELQRNGDDDADLVYLADSQDYAKAREKGFSGEYPGFPASGGRHTGVLAAFMRRLPPRSRTDFDTFLTAIRIHPGTSISDFALLGYAGGKLPGDDFYVIHPFDNVQPPLEFLLLVAGYRYYRDHIPYEEVKPGMAARFEFEPDNPKDSNAVRIVLPGISEQAAGYVCRGLLDQVRCWMHDQMDLHAEVERKNGADDHPLIYLFVTVRARKASRSSEGQAVSVAP